MEEVLNYIQRQNGFLILTHRRPDGDTLGCAAGLCLGLRSLGKTAYVARNPEVTPRYLPFVEPCFPREKYAAQTVLTVDTATPEMLPDIWRKLPIDARIDHHPTLATYAPVSYVSSEAAACGEIVLAILQALSVKITPDIALPLYLAITTDTGCFRYASTTADTHRAAALLMDTGINTGEIDEMVFSRKTRARIEVESAVLQGMEFLAHGKIAIGFLPLEMVERLGAGEDDMENVAALPRQIQDVVIGITMRQELDGWKISVRSAADYKANQICVCLQGGGHARAAGCRVSDSNPAVVRRKILEAIQCCYPEEFPDIADA